MKKRIFKPFLAWQLKTEEDWLNQMSRDGWSLTEYRFFQYYFEKNKPVRITYRTDYDWIRKKHKEGYLKPFQEAGWTHTAEWLGWHYFRSEREEASFPYICPKRISKLSKLTKIRILFILCFLLLCILAIIAITTVTTTGKSIAIFGLILSALFMMGILHLITDISTRILRIKREICINKKGQA
jgi:hypothetical protein